ncbi:hypothetical protein QTP88_006228 [Uroleucon formosanum]
MFELTIPSPTENQLRQNSSQFFSKWNFPNCVGAIDGKHIRIKAPKRSGSLYFNYKEYYSIVLIAVVDADCKFTAVDIGSYGREGDAGIHLKSQIGKIIKNNTFNIPAPKEIPGTNTVVPHVIVGDEAFALHENFIKPYPRQQSVHDPSKAVYNYRLSRARRTTENTFGILCGYFRLFFLPIATTPETTDKLITCACILYNILRGAKVLAPGQKHFDDALPLPTENLIPITEHNVRAKMNHTQIREIFKNYFNGPGAVEWQHKFEVKFPNSSVPRRETVYRLIKKFEKHGSVVDAPRSGRPRTAATNENMMYVASGVANYFLTRGQIQNTNPPTHLKLIFTPKFECQG